MGLQVEGDDLSVENVLLVWKCSWLLRTMAHTGVPRLVLLSLWPGWELISVFSKLCVS